ncbi:hypothetical protein [Algoriphagus marinus]|uniref:hypothetical protein n=1 Tax=Algoriphagus marinus TaxID=1925762 RepID=UPI001FE3C83B|nr:hypothetical protein [Algoriphagus marinus]
MKTQSLLRSAKLVIIMALVLLSSCKSEYEKVESRELASGKIVNEIFLGLELGMDKKKFYETCWDLNKQGVLSNGPGELSIEYNAELPSGNPAKMRFYPKFEDDKIYMMPVEFTYEGWAPWNEELAVEKLREDVVAFYEQWFGPGFFEVTNEDKTQIVFVKIDGNRRIRVFKKHESVVRAEIMDLKFKKEQAKKPA